MAYKDLFLGLKLSRRVWSFLQSLFSLSSSVLTAFLRIYLLHFYLLFHFLSCHWSQSRIVLFLDFVGSSFHISTIFSLSLFYFLWLLTYFGFYFSLSSSVSPWICFSLFTPHSLSLLLYISLCPSVHQTAFLLSLLSLSVLGSSLSLSLMAIFSRHSNA